MRETKISVVMATYNGERYLLEQLDSLKNQTRVIDEVLIVDDCSKDNTVNMVNGFIDTNDLSSSWKLMCNSYNKGYALNFYDAICQAQGDYIFFCDQDDIWDNNKILFMEKALDDNSSIGVLASDLELFYSGENHSVWKKEELDSMSNTKQIERIDISVESLLCQRSACTMAIRKEYWNSIREFWIKDWAHDDFVWKFSVLDSTCNIFHYKGIKRRLHENNTTNIKIRTRSNRIQQIKDNIKMYSVLNEYAHKKEIVKSYDVLKKYQKCNELRLNILEGKSFIKWILLWHMYRDCFQSKKAILLDLYLVFFSNYKTK